MKNKKFLMIAAGALVLVLAVVAVVLCLPKDSPDQPQLGGQAPNIGTNDNTPGATSPNGGQTPSNPIVPGGNASGNNNQIHDYYPMVTFLTHNNQTQQRVSPGTLPQVPSGESGYDNIVFTGWNAPITKVTEDTTFEAVYEDISNKENVFVLNTVYTTENSAELTLSLRGKVKLSVADLEIAYDPTVIRVEDVLKADSSVQYNVMPEKGRIKVSVLLTDNLEAAMDCFKLKLSFVDPNASTAQLDITVEDAAYQDANSKLKDAASGTISGKLVRIS